MNLLIFIGIMLVIAFVWSLVSLRSEMAKPKVLKKIKEELAKEKVLFKR